MFFGTLGHLLQLSLKAADLGCLGWSRGWIRNLLRSHPASVTPCFHELFSIIHLWERELSLLPSVRWVNRGRKAYKDAQRQEWRLAVHVPGHML